MPTRRDKTYHYLTHTNYTESNNPQTHSLDTSCRRKMVHIGHSWIQAELRLCCICRTWGCSQNRSSLPSFHTIHTRYISARFHFRRNHGRTCEQHSPYEDPRHVNPLAPPHVASVETRCWERAPMGACSSRSSAKACMMGKSQL